MAIRTSLWTTLRRLLHLLYILSIFLVGSTGEQLVEVEVAASPSPWDENQAAVPAVPLARPLASPRLPSEVMKPCR